VPVSLSRDYYLFTLLTASQMPASRKRRRRDFWVMESTSEETIPRLKKRVTR